MIHSPPAMVAMPTASPSSFQAVTTAPSAATSPSSGRAGAVERVRGRRRSLREGAGRDDEGEHRRTHHRQQAPHGFCCHDLGLPFPIFLVNGGAPPGEAPRPLVARLAERDVDRARRRRRTGRHRWTGRSRSSGWPEATGRSRTRPMRSRSTSRQRTGPRRSRTRTTKRRRPARDVRANRTLDQAVDHGTRVRRSVRVHDAMTSTCSPSPARRCRRLAKVAASPVRTVTLTSPTRRSSVERAMAAGVPAAIRRSRSPAAA